MNKKFGNYFFYAIGEIILVMIGILLALQVNNWNEERKVRSELKSILNTVKQDLIRDTLVAGGLVKYYEENEKNSLKLLNGEITLKNIDSNPAVYNLVTLYRPFPIQAKGFELLKEFSNQNMIKTDTLVTAISQFYVPFMQIIDDSNNFVKKEVLSNIDSYKEKSWFVDWTQGKITKEVKQFYATSDQYKKQVASHNVFAGKNHKTFIDLYSKSAKKLIEEINKRLNNQD